MRKHRLLLLVLLASVACRKTPEPIPASLSPNTLRFVQSPVLRASDEEQVTRLGVRSWLVFEKDGMHYQATWEERGKTRPVALDPDLTYEFTITWLGWHIDMCQVVSIRQGGRLIWENPDSWLGKTAHGK